MSSTSPGRGPVPFDEIDITAELGRRPARPPDFEAEAGALAALAEEMARSPRTVLRRLAELALGLCRADSAGISLAEVDGGTGAEIFRWHATAGRFAPSHGGIMDRDFSPCGAVLGRNAPLLLADPDRHYGAVLQIEPRIRELLLVPFHRGEGPIGTVWAIAHDEGDRFDAEDARLLASLSRFASAAAQILDALDEAKRSEAEVRRLREEERAALGRAARILESVTDAFYSVDRDWRFTYLNPQAELQLRRRPGELVGKVVWEEFPSAVGSKFEVEYHKAMAEGRPVSFEEYYPEPLNAWFEATGYPSEDGLSVYFRDVTARKRSEEALLAEGRRKDEFLAMLAHELRNPLAAIGNAAGVVRLADSDSEREWAAEVVRRQAGHLAHLIDDLLDVSRIDRGLIRLKARPLGLAEVVGRAVETIRPLIDERRHALEVDLGPDPIRLEADPTRLEQILGNLLSNAAKYTEPGGNIRISARRRGPEAVVRVSDTGRGIRPDLLPHVFDLFTQGDRAIDRSEGGLGIGLKVVKDLVELHGGSIAARSAGPGLGSSFEVRLPALDDAPAEPPELPEPPRTAPERRAMRILVVDDLVDAARGLSRLLELEGHAVEVAFDGPAALEAADRFGPDVVLLDLGLPGMDGFEVARRLRSSRPDGALLIAVSGYGREEDRRRSAASGFDHHLVKPVDLDALARLLTGGDSGAG